MLAEARNLLQAYARKCVNIHFENLNDMVLEAAKSSLENPDRKDAESCSPDDT